MTQPPLTALDKLKGFHLVYCETTGNQLSLTNHRMDMWARWERNGWSAADLRLTLKYILRSFYSKDRPRIARSMVHFDKIVLPQYDDGGNPHYSYFEQLLCDAKADQRNHRPPPSPKAIVLAQANREMPLEQGEPKQASDVAEQILKMCEAARKAIE